MGDTEQQPAAAEAETPPDEWAQVEVFGHRRHFGRIGEVERFGARLLRIDALTDDPAVFETLFYGGASIFSIMPCTEESARAYAASMRARPYTPATRLPPPDANGSEEFE